ncbi:hypothetical protein KC799_01085 [candidate division KSB1 bacterium]|nr:hypothetical protein [candidate division KSB1 bacterium]
MANYIQIYPNDVTEIDMSHLIDELRLRVRTSVPPYDADSTDGISMWVKNCYRLRELILLGNPEKFLRWDVMLETMVVTNPHYMAVELNHLLAMPEWANRWKDAVREPHMGWPVPYNGYMESSGNLLHLAYHLSQFEQKTGRRIDEMEYIFEFGGGYGAMSHLCYALGFQGKYVIFDFPIFAALQTFYLKALGHKILDSVEEFKYAYEGILCLSEIEQIEEVLPTGNDIDPALMIATWSLSEVPFELRAQILENVDLFHAFLIAYQDIFEKRDNERFFKEWQESLLSFKSESWPIKHLPGNFYLMGSREG